MSWSAATLGGGSLRDLRGAFVAGDGGTTASSGFASAEAPQLMAAGAGALGADRLACRLSCSGTSSRVSFHLVENARLDQGYDLSPVWINQAPGMI